MSKWINQYLKKFNTDNADNVQKMSVLSVPISLVIEKIEIKEFDIAGDNLITTTSLKNSNFKGVIEASTDNTDNSDKTWSESVKRSISDHNKAASMLESFIVQAINSGLDLLPDDKKWLKKICAGVSCSKLKESLDQYACIWKSVMEKEPLPHKKQNIGRFTASTFLLEKLKTAIINSC